MQKRGGKLIKRLQRVGLDEKKVQQEGLMVHQENPTKMLCESIQ